MSDIIKTSLTLANLSVVDHAVVGSDGLIYGGSYNPSFLVSGKTDPVEKVVVDFSSIKKTMKTLIDRHEFDIQTNGFDHKLWVIPGISNCTVEENDDGTVGVITPLITVKCPADAVRVFHHHDYANDGYTFAEIEAIFEDEVEADLQMHLRKLYPDVDVSVKCFNNTAVHTLYENQTALMFSYVHGLRDSTSYGCKNIAHGHLSYSHLFAENLYNTPVVNDVLIKFMVYIMKQINGRIFIRHDNIKEMDSDSLIHLNYTTPRGEFTMVLNAERVPCIILQTETTIEFIVEHVRSLMKAQFAEFVNTVLAEKYRAPFKEAIGQEVDVVMVISEGLSKGCQTEFALSL